MKSDNPITRLVITLLLIVVGLRLIVELLKPVVPYVLLALGSGAAWRLWRSYRDRW